MFFKHPLAVVEAKTIGDETKIWQFSVVLERARIGRNCNINAHCFVENDVGIGDNVTIKCGVYIWDGITIENDVFVGPNVTFTNDLLPRSKKYPEKFVRTVIGRGASIGANATIIAGIAIGEFAMIGAGAVVTKDVPKHTLWYGNPARMHGYVCTCGKKLGENLFCADCNTILAL